MKCGGYAGVCGTITVCHVGRVRRHNEVSQRSLDNDASVRRKLKRGQERNENIDRMLLVIHLINMVTPNAQGFNVT